MSVPQPPSTPAFKRKIRFGTIDVGSGSGSESDSDSESIDNLEAPPTHQQDVPDYYDPIYFDSDEEDETDAEINNEQRNDDQDDDEKEYDIRAGLSADPSNNAAAGSSSSSSQITDITKKLESSSMSETTKPTKKNKRHSTISDADLLYDPDADDRDENWLIKKISANRPPGCRPEDIWTDAILSCPMCLTQLCFDCQQHDVYTHQFRAMFVEHCRVVETERLRFPNVPKKNNNNNKSKKANKSGPSLLNSTSSPGNAGAEKEPQEFKPSPDDDMDAVYNPVVCEICNTKVALMDQDEVFHFFNTIPTAV